MGKYFTLDLETSIGYQLVEGKRKEGIQGPTFRNPDNDFYTIIYGSHPDKIKVVHKKQGFKRRLPYRVGKALLQSKIMITQNGKFDLGYIWQDKYFQQWLLNGGQVWDCAVARYLLSCQRHQYPSLAEMQQVYLGIKTKVTKISYLFSKKIEAKDIIAARHRCPRIWAAYCKYSVEDGRTPMLIMQKQYREANDKGMLPIITMFNQYLISLAMIEQNGIDIDMKKLEENEQIIYLEKLEHLKLAEDMAKQHWSDPRLPPLNINSNDHKSLILFGGTINCKVKHQVGMTKGSKATKTKEAVEPKPKYKTELEAVEVTGFGLSKNYTTESAKAGYYTTNAATIEKIYDKCKDEKAKEFCKAMKLAATSEKMLGTYIKGIKDRTVNGKLYPNLNNTEVITTRLSSSKINMQNIPSTGRYNKLIQGVMVAPEGWTCVSIDFSQLEVYVQAMLSGDVNLINDIRNGKCLHCQNVAWASKSLGWTEDDITYEQAVQWCKKEKIPEWEARRSAVKPITFGKAYGKEVASASRDTGIPEPVMQKIYDDINAQYPQVAEFEQLVSDTVYANTYVSKKSDYADKYTKGTKQGQDLGRRFCGNAELLPIKRGKGQTEYDYDVHELRHIGYYTAPTGKRYAFEERATRTARGDLYKYYLSTQMKNYPVQGGASDIQGCTTVELFPMLLRNPDKVKMLNEIHDDKWFIVKNEYLSCIVPKLCYTMSIAGQILKRRFRIETDLVFANEASIGPNFSDMDPYKP